MNHEKTIKRIQELVPDVMVLEDGCRVTCFEIDFGYSNKEDFIRTFYRPFGIREGYDKKGEFVDDGDGYYFDNINLLGKPITLAVILLAIGKQLDEDAWEVAINSDGQFIKDWGENKHEMTDYYWNLSKDNFNDQSEETKTFIGNLLNNK